MALQILPREQSFGSQLGSSLGTGVGQGLSMLLQHKVGEIQTQKKVKAWESIGLDPEMAKFIVGQPEWLQKQLVGRMEGLGQPQGQPQGQPLGQPQGQPQGQQQMQQLGSTPSSSRVTVGASAEDKKRSHEQQKIINKEVYPVIKDIRTKAKGARENNIRLDRMEKLIETGKINNPTFASLLKAVKHGPLGAGIDLAGLLSPESQEFDKLSGDFIKNAKDIFGSRITDTDLKYFLTTIPNLSQSNEGKMRVIRNLKLMNKAVELREKASRELMKRYKNRVPIDFEDQVDEIVKPQIDAITEEFKAGTTVKAARTTTLPGDLIGGLGQAFLGVS